MNDERISDSWRIDKRVSYGHLLTTLVVLVSLFAWSQRLETRVLLNEQMIISVEKRHDETANNIERRMAFMETAIEEHQKELLRKIEKLDDQFEEHAVKRP